MATDAQLAERLAELEARFTLQQDTLDKLSDVLWRQQRELDAVRARAAALEARMGLLAAGPADAEPPEDPPPHY